jgi:hypothetical protein
MSRASARKPLLATFVTCVLLGPLVGGLVILLSVMPVDGGLSDVGAVWAMLVSFISTLVLLPFSYISGGPSAIASGLAMVVYGWFNGRPPLWFALVCAVATYAVLQSVQNHQGWRELCNC